MTKYQVVGYYVQQVAVEVEADTPEEAEEIGYELLMEDKGENLDGDWQDEIDVNELVEND